MPPLYAHDPFLHLQGLLWGDTPFTDWLWLGATWACTGWGMPVIALLFTWWRTGTARRLVWRAVPAFASLLAAGAIAQGVKALVRTPRPQAVLEPGTFHVLEILRGTHSFPSGHSASAAALATWAVLQFGWRGWPLVLLGILGGLSRVAVGAHWTIDVLGGWTAGILGALAVRWFELERARRKKASGGAGQEDPALRT